MQENANFDKFIAILGQLQCDLLPGAIFPLVILEHFSLVKLVI